MKFIAHFLVFVLLTLVTQIGGLIYLISIFLFKHSSTYKNLKRIGFFITLYLITSLIIVPILAPAFGRERIKDSNHIVARSFFYKIANRNYVKPELNKALELIANDLNELHNGVKLVYLDANFPFFDQFPLLPHLSHNDGKKIDVCFIYENPEGQLTNKKPSLSGYGIFEPPLDIEYDQIKSCKQAGYWQYDFPKYLSFGNINKDVVFSANGTQDLIRLILNQRNIEKLFIEPHIKSRLNLSDHRVRFHGCRAVRHDDHIHFQLR